MPAMNLYLGCACGANISITDAPPATSELLMQTWSQEHPHDNDRALTYMLSAPSEETHDDDPHS